MNSLTSFVKLSDNETVLHEWEVLHDGGGFRASDIIILLALSFAFAMLQTVSGEMINASHGIPIIRDILRFIWPLVGLVFYTFWFPILLALALTALIVYSRPVISGQVALTNWRLLYYERGEGRLSRIHHSVDSVNLEDVVGVHSNYRERLWGVKSLVISVYTKHKGGIVIRIGDSGGLLGKLPLIGAWFGRHNIGPDAAALLPVAFRLIQDYKGRTTNTGVSY